MSKHAMDPSRDRWFLGTYMHVRVARQDSAGALSVVEQTMPAGFSPPLHRHENEDGLVVVLEGRLLVQVGDARHTVQGGQVALLPKGVPHTFLAEVASRILEITTPGGIEEFYAENGEPARDAQLPEPTAPDIARLAATARTRDIEILGPPLGPARP